jgi:hypothetical protein
MNMLQAQVPNPRFVHTADTLGQEMSRQQRRWKDVSVLGKFPMGTTYNAAATGRNIYINHASTADFKCYGSDAELNWWVDEPLRKVVAAVNYAAGHDQAPYHFMTSIDAGHDQEGKPLSVVSYMFEATHRDAAGRHLGFTMLAASMRTRIADRLIEVVGEYPDAAEHFFQKAAPGLERTPGSEAGPGLTRKLTAGVVLLDGAGLAPVIDPFLDDNLPHVRFTEIIPHIREAAERSLPYSEPVGYAPRT